MKNIAMKMGNCHIPSFHFWLFNLACKNRTSGGYLGVYWALDCRLYLMLRHQCWGGGVALFKAVCPKVKVRIGTQSCFGKSVQVNKNRILKKNVDVSGVCVSEQLSGSNFHCLAINPPPPPHSSTSGSQTPPASAGLRRSSLTWTPVGALVVV